MRPETGPMQFENDWTGLFIRGDNAFHYALALEELLDKVIFPQDVQLLTIAAPLYGLLQDLKNTNHNNKDRPKPQLAKLIDPYYAEEGTIHLPEKKDEEEA